MRSARISSGQSLLALYVRFAPTKEVPFIGAFAAPIAYTVSKWMSGYKKATSSTMTLNLQFIPYSALCLGCTTPKR